MRTLIARYSKYLCRGESGDTYVPNETPRAMLRHSLLSLDGEIKENGMGYNFSLNSGRDVHGRVFIVDGTSEQSMSEIVLSFEGDDSGLDEIIHKLSFHPLGKHVIYKELYSLMDVYSLDKEP